jgi:hypothetical protein
MLQPRILGLVGNAKKMEIEKPLTNGEVGKAGIVLLVHL